MKKDITQIQDWLVTRLAQALDTLPESIDTRKPFANYNLDSATAVEISGDIEEWLDCSLAPTLLWKYPTIERLAKQLAKKQGK